MTRKLGIDDYPVAEQRPELVRGIRGKSLDDITLDALMNGEAGIVDLRITPGALRLQAQIAEAAGRAALAANFERAAELAAIPQAVIMEFYELLRPGRAETKQTLLDAAQKLRDEFQAPQMAEFVEEAADVYDRRGLFRFRY
jgi:propanediol dehydratase small subunit